MDDKNQMAALFFESGDLLTVRCWYRCFPYSHFGIYMGDGTVIELASDSPVASNQIPTRGSMQVRRTSLAGFARGSDIRRVSVSNALPTEEVLRRAESKLGLKSYCIVTNNCEHFARWCKSGESLSEQVNDMRMRALRSVSHAATIAGAGFAIRRAHSTGLTAVGGSRALTGGVSMLVGEIAEGVTKVSLARSNLCGESIDSRSRAVGVGASVIVAALLGGPMASASAIALHTLSRLVSDNEARRLQSMSKPKNSR